jgi:hypothetical protein
MPDTNTDKPIAGGVDVAPADGSAAGSDEVSTMHEVLSKALGKEFKDDESAMKAVKDTFAYVGKVGKFAPKLDALQQKFGGETKLLEFMDQSLNNSGTPAPVVDTSQFVTKEEMAREMFYKDNPDYKPYQSVIDALAKTEGKTPTEVVQSDSFKPFFEKAKASDDRKKRNLCCIPILGLVQSQTQRPRCRKPTKPVTKPV